MKQIVLVTFKGIIRDRVLHGVALTALLFLLIPSVSSFSMRQVAELSLILSLSCISFILFMLSVFLGGTLLWKDIERRYCFSVLSLPISRTKYLIGKFLSVMVFILATSLLLGLATIIVVAVTSSFYPPDRPVVWQNVILSIAFDSLKYIIVIAIAFFFASLSTSFFLPIFGTIAIFFAGNATQQVYDYVMIGGGKALPLIVRESAKLIYYVLPNFNAFNLNTYAVYGIPLDLPGVMLTFIYFIIYTAIVLVITSAIFSRRELT